MRRHLDESHVRPDLIALSSRTSSARATLADDGSATYHFDITWELDETTALPACRLVHTGSIGSWMAPGTDRVHALLAARPTGVIATFDPNIRPSLIDNRQAAVARIEELASLVDLVKLSDEDAAWLYPKESPEAVLRRLLDLGPAVAVMTQGGAGALALSAGARVELPAATVDVVDTIGAGDAFMSGLIDAWLAADPSVNRTSSAAVQALLGRGMATGALTVARAGANPPWRHELDAYDK
ncbi:carbohydrate kinase [Leifsonia kafniensis]|uniref:Carbohydrate kinase n=1 Tax=Leifsonia kafniensis TaxID=475957 RepID=A0ABP7L4V5_9MICO